MRKFEELGSTVHGEIEYGGEIIRLTQDAYCDSDFSLGYERVVYRACGIDCKGIMYEITWLPVECYEELTCESDICDWDNPYYVEIKEGFLI